MRADLSAFRHQCAETFYRWLHRYSPGDLTTLERISRRPRRLRQPSWSAALEQAVLKPRRHLPGA